MRLPKIPLLLLSLLIIPLIAMQFSNEVQWSGFDFLLMGVLLFVLGLSIEWILKKTRTSKTRSALLIVVVITFLLVWAELAVGIFNTPFAGT